MADKKPDNNGTDEILRTYLLTDGELTDAERLWAGSIRLIASGRYGARFDVDGVVLTFCLGFGEDGKQELLVSPGYDRSAAKRNLELRVLVWHRVTEAILAVRKGHDEYNKRRSARELSEYVRGSDE